MKISLVTPAPPGSNKGNRVTAERWAHFLRELGHDVSITEPHEPWPRADVLVALHARRSADAALRFRRERPSDPLVVVLTGTDLYGDIHEDQSARQTLEQASRLVVLQEAGVAMLPEPLRSRARVIYQSAAPPAVRLPPDPNAFDVCVLGHLRPVKDPFRTAEAAWRLPPDSRIRVLQVGAALEEAMAEQAFMEQARNPRYHWLGELPQDEALAVLSRSRLLSLTSTMEGGANVISEALAAGVPVVCSDIPGSIGMVGAGYPGTFPTGDTGALTTLLRRAEVDAAFCDELARACARRAALVTPDREREALRALFEELSLP